MMNAKRCEMESQTCGGHRGHDALEVEDVAYGLPVTTRTAS